MKFASILAAVLLATSLQAQVLVTNVFEQQVNSVIPDANPTGLTSTDVISGTPGTLQSIQVSLDITGGFNGDLYAYLAFGDGFAVLLNRVGKTDADPYGYGDAGFNITLSDTAATDIHLYGGNGGEQLTGTWQPDGRNVDPQIALDSDPRSATLSLFDGTNPNGTWTLFVEDAASGYESTLISWSIQTISIVPEPSSFAVLMLSAGMGITAIGWNVRKRKASSAGKVCQ